MSSSRVDYRLNNHELVATFPVPTREDYELMQAASGSVPTVVLDVLPTDTNQEVAAAEKACIATARGQAYDRRSGSYFPVREEIVATAVGRTIANGGMIVRLWATGRNGSLQETLNEFWDTVAAERRAYTVRRQRAARFAIIPNS